MQCRKSYPPFAISLERIAYCIQRSALGGRHGASGKEGLLCPRYIFAERSEMLLSPRSGVG